MCYMHGHSEISVCSASFLHALVSWLVFNMLIRSFLALNYIWFVFASKILSLSSNCSFRINTSKGLIYMTLERNAYTICQMNNISLNWSQCERSFFILSHLPCSIICLKLWKNKCENLLYEFEINWHFSHF